MLSLDLNNTADTVLSSGTDLAAEGYFPALLSAVQAAGPNLPFDPVILQSILLCLVAPGGCKNLLLRAKDDDVGFVQNLTAVILAKIFGYTAQKVRTRPKQSSSEFLHSLFLHDKSPPRRHQPSRKSMWSVHRTSSEPSELTPSPADHNEWNSVKQSTVNQPQSRPRIRALEIQTEPPPALKDFESSSSQGNAIDQMLLPGAIVCSGLEHSGPTQRALLHVLAEKRVIFEDETDGVWNLPEGFVIIYVCPVDQRERPKIHASLLDRFAMSVTVSPSAAARQAYAIFRSEIQTPLTGSFPIVSSSDLAYLRSLTVNFHPSLSLYMDDLFTAARHHHELDGTLLTTRAHKDAEALIRAQRLVCGDSTSTELIRTVEAKTMDDLPEDSIFRDQDAFDDMNTVRVSLDWIEGAKRKKTSGGGRTDEMGDIEEDDEYEDSATRRIREQGERMDVSEVDVAKIVPRVVSHRLRVRDGPDHEIFSSVMYPAASPDGQGKSEGQRKTVKDILVKILSGV